MALACLARITPLHAATGDRYTVRVCNMNDRRVTGIGGETWEPAMVQAPILGIALWNGDFQQPVQPAAATLGFNVKVLKETYEYADASRWVGATVEIFAESPDRAWPWEPRFAGKVTGFGRKGQVLSLSCEADDASLKGKILTATYAGTGGAEGMADLKNKLKPLVLGRALSVEPVLINAVDMVYQFSGYGAIEEVTTLFERASAFPAAVADHANYAALVAATITPGNWATCLAEGMIRLGAPAYGVITGDVKGHKVGSATPRLTGQIISALATIAGVDPAKIDTASLDAMDAAVPYYVNVVISDQAEFIDQARDMALGCNYQSGLSLTGKFFVTGIDFDSQEMLTFEAQGRRSPQVLQAEEADVSAPYWKTIMGAERCWRPHTTEEIAFAAPLLDKGRYDDAETYREGNYVDQPDGSRWLYIYASPTVGNDPPVPPATSNTWWTSLSPVFDATAASYSDGTPIEDLQPSEPAADVTSAISGLADITIAADHTGAVTATLPRTSPYKLFRNGVDVTTSTTWSVSIVSGTLTASIGASDGVLSLNASSGTLTNAVLRITAVYSGTTRTLDVKVTKELAPAPTTGGGGSGSAGSATGNVLGSTSSTTMVAVGDELTVDTGTAGQVVLSASYNFSTGSSSGSYGEYAQWYWWNGSAYAALGSEVAASVNWVPIDGEPGYGECNYTATGLTASSTQKFKLYMRNSSGTVTRDIYGSCSAVGS